MIESKRLQSILDLLSESKGTVTGEFLCNNLGVSSRTIRSDIKDLNKIIEKNGAVIISERARGYKLDILDKNLFNNLISRNKEKKDYNNGTSLGRVENIIIKLLINEIDNIEGVTQIELADELFVSVSSLKNDIKIVKDTLEEYNLKLEKISNKGIRIIGVEDDLRNCIKKYMNSNTVLKNKVMLQLANIFKDENYNEINSIVKDNISKFDFKLSDKAFNEIINIIIIMIIRDNSENNIKYNDYIKDELGHAYRHKVAENIFQDIERKLNIKLNEDEVFYLTKYIAASTSIEVESNENLKLNNEYELVAKILVNICDEFNVDFLEDKVLIDFLAHHIKAAIYRAQYGINIENSLLTVIKNSYPFALELAVYSNDVIKGIIKCDLSEDDIGFIALHFAAALERIEKNLNSKKNIMIVCENGIGTSLLLKVKLEAKFKERINNMDTIPRYEFNKDVLDEYDLIISTVNLNIESSKIVYIKSLLDNNEINLIHNKINGNLLSDNVLVSKFKEELFFNTLEGSKRDEILESMTNELIIKGYITENVKKSIFKREELASTEIGELVAIPHAMSEEISESFIAVGILKKAVTWDKEKVQVVFFIGMSTDDKEEWKIYLQQLYKNIMDSDVIKNIIKCQSFNDLKKIVSKF